MMLDFPQPVHIKYKKRTARSDQSDDLILLDVNADTFEHRDILLGGIVESYVSKTDLPLSISLRSSGLSRDDPPGCIDLRLILEKFDYLIRGSDDLHKAS
jgi:hypothetical protein